MPEEFTLNPDGTITFDLDGAVRVLRRPTLRQYRDALETLSALRDEIEPSAEDEGFSTTVKIQLDKIVLWLDHIFKELAGEALPRTSDGEIDDTKLPAWLLSGELIASIITHWQAVPSHRGGR